MADVIGKLSLPVRTWTLLHFDPVERLLGTMPRVRRLGFEPFDLSFKVAYILCF
jgi:hypothetical protein